MTYVRREVRSWGEEWPEVLLWYAKAVGILKSRPLNDRTSWWFLGAIHGISPDLWRHFGLIPVNSQMPAPDVQKEFWSQCQHQSWYFLPWHRGYIHAFEEIVRAVVVDLEGPEDWALPYWNYSLLDNPNARYLPEAFSQPTLPDGSKNHLYVERRYGSGVTPIEVDARSVLLNALNARSFTGRFETGLGGPETVFHHGPERQGANGWLESLPHNNLHGDIGGAEPGKDPNRAVNLGLMSMPRTAGLDPIFWLHHANIDRLWAIWNAKGGTNPTDVSWLNGPAGSKFAMPKNDVEKWEFSPRDVLTTTTAPLDYVYDDMTAVVPPPRLLRRLGLAGIAKAQAEAINRTLEAAVPSATTPDLVGASAGEIIVNGQTNTDIKLDEIGAASLRQSLARLQTLSTKSKAEPARVFLKLEGVQGTAEAAVYFVYVDVPSDADPLEYPDRLAGSISLFGASPADGELGEGSGIDEVIEITEIIDDLQIAGDDLAKIHIRFEPSNRVSEACSFSIKRVSVYKLGD